MYVYICICTLKFSLWDMKNEGILKRASRVCAEASNGRKPPVHKTVPT